MNEYVVYRPGASLDKQQWPLHCLHICMLQVLETVQEAVAAHVAANPSQYSAKPLVTWKALEEPLKLRLAVGVTYSFTGNTLASVSALCTWCHHVRAARIHTDTGTHVCVSTPRECWCAAVAQQSLGVIILWWRRAQYSV